jgi:hypothetical protein
MLRKVPFPQKLLWIKAVFRDFCHLTICLPQDSPPLTPKKRRKMDELCDRVYENLETDHENIEFDLRALRLMEILSNKGISLRN